MAPIGRTVRFFVAVIVAVVIGFICMSFGVPSGVVGLVAALTAVAVLTAA
jgi:hypothetical protein